MAKGREQEIRSVAADGTNDVARLAGHGVAALHRRLRRCLGLLDPVRVGVGFDREDVIGAQPEADLDRCIRSRLASRDFRIGGAGEDRLGFGDGRVGAFAPERRLRRARQDLQNAEQGFEVIGLPLKQLAEL